MPGDPLCPFCGAYSPRSCELSEDAGVCAWEESEPDPDILREDRDERRRIEKESADDQ
jgi:hypothetical protein